MFYDKTPVHTVKIGELEIANRILLIDPCYHIGHSDNNDDGINRSAVSGKWSVFYDYRENDFGGKHAIPIRLWAKANNNTLKSDVWKIVEHKLAVDSASLGVFDYERYPRRIRLHTQDNGYVANMCYDLRDNYYNEVCEAKQNEYGCGMIEEGVASYTARGDGHHRADIVMNMNRKACGVVIHLFSKREYPFDFKEKFE